MKPPTILLMSSNELVHRRFPPVLKALGCYVEATRDGDDALMWLLRGGISLMITDLYVPCIAGDCLTQAVKEFSDTADVPIICLSGDRRLEDFRRALESGADAFFPDEIEPAALIDTIERLLIRAERARATGDNKETFEAERPVRIAEALAEWAMFCRRREAGYVR